MVFVCTCSFLSSSSFGNYTTVSSLALQLISELRQHSLMSCSVDIFESLTRSYPFKSIKALLTLTTKTRLLGLASPKATFHNFHHHSWYFQSVPYPNNHLPPPTVFLPPALGPHLTSFVPLPLSTPPLSPLLIFTIRESLISSTCSAQTAQAICSARHLGKIPGASNSSYTWPGSLKIPGHTWVT